MKKKKSRVIYVDKVLLPMVSVIFILSLILYSKTAVGSALKGIKLWLEVVFPSLFPFFVGAEFLRRTGFIKAMGILLEPIMRPLFKIPGCGSFAFAMGITSGYPVGAKITKDLREEKLITKGEAERLLAFSNNSGPLFIIGAVSVGMFKLPPVGIFMLACHILACITVGVVFGFFCGKKYHGGYKSRESLLARFKTELAHPQSKDSNIGIILGEAVGNSISLILAVGGFIILFSVIINILLEIGLVGRISELIYLLLYWAGIDKHLVTSLVCGFFEITTGTNMASQAVNAAMVQRLTAASMIIGWAGLSVHFQVISIVSKAGISIKTYLLGKFLQGIFAAVYTYCGIKITGLTLTDVKPAALILNIPQKSNWYDYLLYSSEYLLFSILVLAICTIISILIVRIINGKKSSF